MQSWLITRPRLCGLLASSAMVLEILFVLAPASDNVCIFVGVNGLLFHACIWVLQGLDFVSYWAPCLLAYLVGVPASEPSYDGLDRESGFFVPALIYTALQVVTAVTLRDFWLDDILPFSCFPMFMLPRNIYDDWPKAWTMSDSPVNGRGTRCAGAMEPLYWSPASPVFFMSEDEARNLPQKVVWFGSTKGAPPEFHKFISPQHLDQPFILFSNFALPRELSDVLRDVVAEVNCGRPDYGWDSARLTKLLELQYRCLELFNECAAASQRADQTAAATMTHSKAE